MSGHIKTDAPWNRLFIIDLKRCMKGIKIGLECKIWNIRLVKTCANDQVGIKTIPTNYIS